MNRIFLIHPLQILRKGICFYIQEQFRSARINEFDSLVECDTSVLEKNDILLININGTNENLLNKLAKLQKKGIKIVIWMDSLEERQVSFLFKQGYFGYFVKEVEENELTKGLEDIINNIPYLHSKLSSLIYREYLKEINSNNENETLLNAENPYDRPSLTRREWEVLECLTKGLSNDKIARKLFLSESTVKNHVSSILRKLEVTDRTAAVVLTIKNEWIKYTSIS